MHPNILVRDGVDITRSKRFPRPFSFLREQHDALTVLETPDRPQRSRERGEPGFGSRWQPAIADGQTSTSLLISLSDAVKVFICADEQLIVRRSQRGFHWFAHVVVGDQLIRWTCRQHKDVSLRVAHVQPIARQ